jgi:hypothetical protein
MPSNRKRLVVPTSKLRARSPQIHERPGVVQQHANRYRRLGRQRIIGQLPGFEMGEAQEQRPVTPQTRFQAASISKTVNALAVLKLVQAGRVALDTYRAFGPVTDQSYRLSPERIGSAAPPIPAVS